MSNRRARSVRPARRVIRTRRPSQTASNSARVISAGRGCQRRLHQDLVLAGLAEHQEAAVAQDGNGRQRRAAPAASQSRPVRARLEPELLGAAQHLGHADRVRSQPMADLLGIGRDALEAQQHHEGGEALMA